MNDPNVLDEALLIHRACEAFCKSRNSVKQPDRDKSDVTDSGPDVVNVRDEEGFLLAGYRYRPETDSLEEVKVYQRFIDNNWLTNLWFDGATVDEMVSILRETADELAEMEAAGVSFDSVLDVLSLNTQDKNVAKRFGFEWYNPTTDDYEEA